jgi:hypothetical protein
VEVKVALINPNKEAKIRRTLSLTLLEIKKASLILEPMAPRVLSTSAQAKVTLEWLIKLLIQNSPKDAFAHDSETPWWSNWCYIRYLLT